MSTSFFVFIRLNAYDKIPSWENIKVIQTLVSVLMKNTAKKRSIRYWSDFPKAKSQKFKALPFKKGRL